MKNFWYCLVACVFASIIHICILKNHALEERAKLLEFANKILEEQIADINSQLIMERSGPTYDDGVRDGIMNSKSQEYMAGYHKGIADQGYHILVNDQMSAIEIGSK